MQRASARRGIEVEAESAGLNTRKKQLTKEIADQADRIFVMGPYMKRAVIDDY